MNEKLQAAIQSLDWTQIVMAAAGGIGGVALWMQKRYQVFTRWRKNRAARNKAVHDLPERVAGFAATLADVAAQSAQALEVLATHSKTLADQNRVLGAISAMVYGDMELDGVPRFVCDVKGYNISVNTAYARLVGCGRDELMGFGYQRFVSQDLNPVYMAAFATAAAQHRSFESVINIKRGDGGQVTAQVRIVPHPENNPPAEYWMGVVTSSKRKP